VNLKKIKLKAYAKVNFYLSVTGLREDGYHLLSSCFQSIGIYDSVKLSKASETTVICDKIAGDNIANKAVRALEKYTGLSLNTKIIIKKRTPSGAGLGGGSADAAAVLKGIRRLYSLSLTDEELENIGASVGADVPFCVRGGTVLAEGIGEKLTTLSDFPDCYLVVAKPKESNPTPEIFKKFDEAASFGEPLPEEFTEGLKNKDLTLLCSLMKNDLEEYGKTDKTDIIKKLLLENGAKASLMTGSGSAVFGVFERKSEAKRARKAIKKELRCFAEVTKPVKAE
jgi:4-diphosphocytidyl-2-C-methyl-D-erythritol kinase